MFDAEVVEFSVQADSATQTFRGRVSVAQPENSVILPGMVANVISSTAAPAPELRVHLSAVVSGPDGAASVWIVAGDNSVSARPVSLGGISADMIAITDGLAEGDTIVSAGVNQIIEDMTIRPIDRLGG